MLAELPRHPFTELCARAQLVRFERDRPLIVEGETIGNVSFLLGGLVKVAAGRLLVDVFRGPSMLVPCASVDGSPSPVTVVAMRSCDVAIIERAALLAAVNATPATAQRLAEMVSREARGYLRRFPELVGGSVEERLTGLLDRLAERHGSPLDEGRYMALPLRRCDLAMMVHATTETVSRTLAEWERRGWLRSNRAGLWWGAKRLREGAQPSVPPRPKSDRPEM
ncbi:MAG: Crp/Fnr family transcriptional regulator [Polyangiales bacterium]